VLSPKVAALAHFPVRSSVQLERKVVLGYLAHLATKPDNPARAFHWRDMFEELRDGGILSEERLRQVAFNYASLATSGKTADFDGLIEDPLQLAVVLRYSRENVRFDTLRLLMRFTEQILAGAIG
jgi:hypothetical protein